MALQAFHANPNIGGFGNENSAAWFLLGEPDKNNNKSARKSHNHDRNAASTTTHPYPPRAGTTNPADESGDALCQIVKELVDNAVDACEAARKQQQQQQQQQQSDAGDDGKVYRVKVEILPYNQNDSEEDDNEDNEDNDEILQVTVSDNGTGMKDIQACVNAFQSSKGGRDAAANSTTVGRYGIGLTLCLLHAQRLVPGTYSCITSATKEARGFKRALYFVDTAGDSVECHREEEVAKGTAEESGTCVSLLVPGGRAAQAAWKRLEIYLRRFQLSSVQCSIEVLAPTLCKVPLHIVRTTPRSLEGGAIHTLSQDTSSAKEQLNEALDMEDKDEDDSDEDRKARKTRNQESFSVERKVVQGMAQKYGYFKSPLKVQNIAHSEHPIRIAGSATVQRSGPNPPAPTLTVDILVSPHEETPARRDDSSHESTACLELVRMVNSVPLLDGAESVVCGLVKALQSSVIWASFGLSFLGTAGNEQDNSWTNTFAIRDSDQVAPFFQSHNHQLWEDKQEPKNDRDGDEDQETGRKRRTREMGRVMMPAKVRLGKILILVDIVAIPSMLPLPTLSKGRLPINHLPITQAFHLGLRDCLRSLQLTSPGLLLTAMQLRTVERDVRYIPLMASAAAGILSRMQDQAKRQQLLRKVKRMNDEDEDGVGLGVLGDREAALHGDEIVRIVERRTAAAILTMESAKKQSRKRVKSTKKTELDNTHEYSDLENSDEDGGRSIRTDEGSPPRNRVHTVTMESQSLDDVSFHSVSPLKETHAQNNKLDAGPLVGVPLECDDDDDDEWW